MSPMTEALVGVHELFVSLVSSGFTEPQALSIVANIMFLNGKGAEDGN